MTMSVICALQLSQGRGIAVAPIVRFCMAFALIVSHIPESNAFSNLIIRPSPAFQYNSHQSRASGQPRISLFALEESGSDDASWKAKFEREQALRLRAEHEPEKAEQERQKAEQERQKAEQARQKAEQEQQEEKQARQKAEQGQRRSDGMNWFCLADLTPKQISFDEGNSLCSTNGPTRVLRELLPFQGAIPTDRVKYPADQYFEFEANETRLFTTCHTYCRTLPRELPIGSASFDQCLVVLIWISE
jgi:hypothetical protein